MQVLSYADVPLVATCSVNHKHELLLHLHVSKAILEQLRCSCNILMVVQPSCSEQRVLVHDAVPAGHILDSSTLRDRLSRQERTFTQNFFVAAGRHFKSSVLDELPPHYQSLVSSQAGAPAGAAGWCANSSVLQAAIALVAV